MATRGEKVERFRKAKVIIFTGTRDKRHGRPCRVTWESTKMLRRQNTGERGKGLGTKGFL